MSACGAGVDPKIWKEYFTDWRCDLPPHPDDTPHHCRTTGGGDNWWHGGTVAHEEGMVLERIEEKKRRRNTPEAKLERAMRGEW